MLVQGVSRNQNQPQNLHLGADMCVEVEVFAAFVDINEFRLQAVEPALNHDTLEHTIESEKPRLKGNTRSST